MLRIRTHLELAIAFPLLALVVFGSAACSGSSTDNGFVQPPPPITFAYCPPAAANSQPPVELGEYQDSLLNGTALPHLIRGSGTPAYGNELDDAYLVLHADSTYDTHGDGVTNGVGDMTMVRDHGLYSQCGATLYFYSETHASIVMSGQLAEGTISLSLPAQLMDHFEVGSHPAYRLFLTKIP